MRGAKVRRARKNPVPTPWLYGFEYEVQFVAKNPETGEIETLIIAEDPLHIKEGWGAPELLSPWAVEEGGQLSDLLESEGIDSDVGNIELRNEEPHGTIDGALLEVNQQLDFVTAFLKRMNTYKFALFLPKITIEEGLVLKTTKHLNISYGARETPKSTLALHKEMAQKLLADYPQYFIQNITGTLEPLELKTNLDNTARMHIKLPYTFTDYTGLFAGTAELPNLPHDGVVGWEEPTLLGYVGKHGKWRSKNRLV